MPSRETLGTGWKFPLRIDARGGFAYSQGEQSVQEAIWVILGTALYERRMLAQFGCGIHDYVFKANNPTNRGQIGQQVREALVRWEPRIDVLNVVVDSPDVNQLLIRIDYRIRSTNSHQNLVYPFYIQADGPQGE